MSGSRKGMESWSPQEAQIIKLALNRGDPVSAIPRQLASGGYARTYCAVKAYIVRAGLDGFCDDIPPPLNWGGKGAAQVLAMAGGRRIERRR